MTWKERLGRRPKTDRSAAEMMAFMQENYHAYVATSLQFVRVSSLCIIFLRTANSKCCPILLLFWTKMCRRVLLVFA